MRGEANLTAVKALAKKYLYLPITPTAYAPIVVDHPFTNSAFTVIGGANEHKTINLLEDADGLAAWRSIVAEQIDACDSVMGLLFFMDKRYRLDFVYRARRYLSPQDLGAALMEAWVTAENPNTGKILSIPKLIALFRSCEKVHLMDETEQKRYGDMPPSVLVYRGVGKVNDKNLRVLSWTLDQERAAWFANRFDKGGGKVYSAVIPKNAVFCYCNRRGENEVIVDPAQLCNIVKVDEVNTI